MKRDQTLKAKCWKCRETFHVRAQPSDYSQKLRRVRKLLPCPYCAAPCELTLGEDRIAAIDVNRGGGPPPETWAEANERGRARAIFDTAEPSSSAEEEPQ